MKRITKISSMLFLLLMTAWTQMFAAGGTEPPFNKTQALKASEIVAGKEIALWVVNVANNWYTGIQNTRSATLTDAVTFIVEDAGNGNIYLKRKSDSKYMKYTASGTSASWVETSDDATAFVAKRPGNVEGGDEKPFSYDYNTDGNLSTPPSWDPNYEYLVRFAVASTAESSSPMFFNGNTAFGTGTGNWSAFLVRDVNVVVPPFTLSDAPKDGQFAENTQWYYLKLHDKYASYNENNEYIPLSSSKSVAPNYLWAFVKDSNNKLKIYNAASGSTKVLAAQPNPNTEGTSYPTLMEETTEGVTITWDYVTAEDQSKFCLNLSGETNKYLNDFAGSNKIAFWYGTTEGSQFGVEEVDLASLIQSAKESMANIPEGAVGALTTTDYAAFTSALDKGTMEGLVEALKIKDQTGKKITMNPNQYYRLESVFSRDKYMEIQSASATASDLNKANASQIWNFSATDDTHYTMSAQGTYTIAATAGSSAITTTKESAEASQFALTARTTIAQFGLTPTTGMELHYNGGANIVGWNGGSGSSWYIIPATDIDVTIGETGYATVNYPFAVQVPEGVTAYTGTVNAEKGVFTLSEVTNGIVPANTPVVLKGTPNTYILTILPKDTEISEVAKSLSGTLLSEEIGGTTNAYILANGNSGIGFYQMNADDRTLGANKAYLELPAEVSNVRSIIFSDGQTTGIEDTVAEGAETEEYYDLQGRRVMNPTKGIYVTKSGKKVLINK